MIEALECRGFQNITIIDNASTYEPLIDYLDKSPHRVVRLHQNLGHLALWRSGQFAGIIEREKFILNDSDVAPAEDCPVEITELLDEVLERYPRHTKAGLSLRIDDLPDFYAFKDQVLDWEKPFWETRLDDGHYEAAIDTTFALYRPGVHCDEERWWRSIRTAPPYSAIHLPWYQNTSNITAEDAYYQRAVAGLSSQWSITDPVLLKNQNTELQHQIAALKREISELKANQVVNSAKGMVKTGLESVGMLNVVRELRSRLRRK
ncbi:MAG TPA: hypothetical protein VFL96_08400 [Acidobacteriaceae bacterium]|nr:hypothetical protein [Acidobacteriaceae bacterium]